MSSFLNLKLSCQFLDVPNHFSCVAFISCRIKMEGKVFLTVLLLLAQMNRSDAQLMELFRDGETLGLKKCLHFKK